MENQKKYQIMNGKKPVGVPVASLELAVDDLKIKVVGILGSQQKNTIKKATDIWIKTVEA